jgi:hypothetical protein
VYYWHVRYSVTSFCWASGCLLAKVAEVGRQQHGSWHDECCYGTHQACASAMHWARIDSLFHRQAPCLIYYTQSSHQTFTMRGTPSREGNGIQVVCCLLEELEHRFEGKRQSNPHWKGRESVCDRISMQPSPANVTAACSQQAKGGQCVLYAPCGCNHRLLLLPLLVFAANTVTAASPAVLLCTITSDTWRVPNSAVSHRQQICCCVIQRFWVGTFLEVLLVIIEQPTMALLPHGWLDTLPLQNTTQGANT